MSIKNKLFNAFNTIISSEKDLKNHLNSIHADFFGNCLNSDKNNILISKLFGIKNKNIIPTLTNKIDDLDDLVDYFKNNFTSVFSDLGFFSSSMISKDTPCFSWGRNCVFSF